ncbi:RNA-directed DNA polymerase, eukaryota [Tanacetum coccineum]|uniref:RNA-directed DNA polymerase, eukaryota n=1 Tax=Tanacetum coccineum TaxID=301880 RepID=A0ABQ5EM76_9ASTR
MAVFDLNQPASSLSEEDDVAASNSHVVSVSSSINTGSSNSLKTPKVVIHHEFIDTPGRSVYWVLRVSASVLPVLGTVYDSLDECIEMEGCSKDVWLNTLDPKKNDRQVRSSNFRVFGCKARVRFDIVPHTTKYTLTTFDLEHNHELDRVEYKQLSKAERRLTYNEQLFIIKAVNANISAVRAHNLYIGLKGSSSLVHGTQTEFKNFTRGVNYFIGDSDAHMLITRMEQRYKMIFVPFTAIDNHYWFRTFEEINNGSLWMMERCDWLAVAAEFPESKHRLCMWHIMQKIPSKLMEEFNLVNHKWLSKMYRLRSSWILAFFVDSPLCGLMRTTSRLESENLFFSYFTSSGSTLVKFMLFYESAMERKRHTQKKLDYQSFDSFPTLLTPLPIEEHIRITVCIIDEEKIKPVGLPEVIDKESTSENVEEEINLYQKVTLHYKEQKNRYGEKNEAIEKLAMEASIILDSCVHMLRNNEQKLFVFVNKMKAIKSELEAELPIIPTRTFSDFVQEFMGVKKPYKVKVKNPTGVRPKEREKQKRIKSEREISMKKTVVPGGIDHVDGGLRDGASGSVSV